MKNIHELIGVIKGINFDGIVNEKEVARLQLWVNKNRNLAYEPTHVSLIRIVDVVLEDKIITPEERTTIIDFCNKIENVSSEEVTRIHELNGIIEGIICDDKVNEAEIFRLKDWMDNYGDYVRGHEPSEVICNIIDDVLSDNIITVEEQEKLLELLANRINFTQIETKIESLKKQVKEKKNIGVELIDLLDNDEVMDMIHSRAEAELNRTLSSYSGFAHFDSEIVFISLVLIAMIHYDGNYYESVRDIYTKLYARYSEQKIEGEIRTVLSKYRLNKEQNSKRSRIINIALENAIVPTHFLNSFFEFIYDIYKLNFEYNLSSDLYDDFSFVYDGLKSSMLAEDDDLEINVTKKTYKLIKTTKQLITDSSNIDAVIKLSIIIANLIDKRIWNKEVRILNPYLKYGYEKWEKTLVHDERNVGVNRTISEFRSRWEPKYILSQNKVYLIPPIHRVKAVYNYFDIRVLVKNGDEIIYCNNEPDIREIIGGYQVNVNKIELSKPVGEICYQLLAGDEIIYESKEKLHRKFIVFDQEGTEIHNNTDFTGTAIFCCKKEHDKIKTYYREEDYILAAMNVRTGEAILLEDVIFNFSSFVTPGIFGDSNIDCFVSASETKNRIPVFQKVKLFMFECNKNIKNFEVLIDGIRKKLTDFEFDVAEKEGSNKYVVYLNDVESGLHNLKVNSLDNGEHINHLNVEFAIDKTLMIDTKKIDEDQYSLCVESVFVSSGILIDIKVDEFDENWFDFTYQGKRYNYYIPFSMSIYKIGEKWIPTTQDMWICDISNESILEIYGFEYDELTVSANSGEILEEGISFKQKGIVRQAHIGFITSYKSTYDFVNIWLIKDGKVKNIIRCYNKCLWDDKLTDIHYDPSQKQLIVYPAFYGKGNVFIEIKKENGTLVYTSDFINNHTTEAISGLVSFEKYNISFVEKAKGLMLNKERILATYPYSFYEKDDFVGKILKIKEVFFDQYHNGNFNRKTHRFNYTYLKITEKESEGNFLGELFATTLKGIYKHTHLNPVEVEFCGDIIDDTVEISITKDGDGLLLDFEHHGIMNNMDDDSAVDIFSYIVDLNEVE